MSLPLCSVAYLCLTPWTTAHQAPHSMEFPRQEHLSGLPSPASRDLPNPGIEPRAPVSPALAGGFFITAPPGKPNATTDNQVKIEYFYF